MSTPTIRSAKSDDLEAIKIIAVDAGMFSEDELGFFDEMFAGALDSSLEGHQWLVVEEEAAVVAAASYAPEPFADRMWNLYFLAVSPSRQGVGLGRKLVAYIEEQLTELGEDEARVLVVETSSTDQYTRTRLFYLDQGYDEEARIRQFYGPDDDKIVSWKSLISIGAP